MLVFILVAAALAYLVLRARRDEAATDALIAVAVGTLAAAIAWLVVMFVRIGTAATAGYIAGRVVAAQLNEALGTLVGVAVTVLVLIAMRPHRRTP